MSISDFDSVLDMISGGGAPTYTGKLVSPRNSVQISAVWACFPAGTLVSTSNGLKAIESINCEDYVYTHCGRSRKVSKLIVHKGFSGYLYRIWRWGATDPITVTGEHPFYVGVRPPLHQWYRAQKFGSWESQLKYQWVKASELEKQSHWLTEPAITEWHTPTSVPVQTKRRTSRHVGKAAVYENHTVDISITADLLRLAGYYLAEGWCEGDRAVRFAFHEAEHVYINDVTELMRRLFNANCTIRQKSNDKSVEVMFGSTLAARFLGPYFGKGAKNKHLPSWALTLPLEMQRELMIGAWRGDGCQYDMGFTYATASRQLAEDLKIICLRAGIVPSLLTNRTEHHPLPYGKFCRAVMYTLSFCGTQGERMGYFLGEEHSFGNTRSYKPFLNGMAHYGIKKIEKELVKDVDVFNLEVDEDESYIADGVAVHNCINVLADDFANLPLPVYRWADGQQGAAKNRAQDHYLWPLLNDEANPDLSAFRWKKIMETWRQLWGNTYSLMDINGRGQVTALWPIRPDRVKVSWIPASNGQLRDIRGRLMYLYHPLDRRQAPIPIPSDQILHIRHVSLDGVTGLSPIEVHRQTLGISMALTEHAGRFYSNGAVIQGVLTHPSKLGPKAQKSLEESLSRYAGLANSHKMLILEENMDYKQIGMKLSDAQYIESCGFNVNEIARIYKVPGHRINEMSSATNNNIEMLSLEYLINTLDPNVSNYVAEIHCSALSARDRLSVFVEPDYTHLLAADHKSRAEYIQSVTTAGAFSPDDVRHREGLNPLPGGVGKMPRVNAATVPLGSDMASGKFKPVPPKPTSEDDTLPPSEPSPKPAPKPAPAPTPKPKKKPKKASVELEPELEPEPVVD